MAISWHVKYLDQAYHKDRPDRTVSQYSIGSDSSLSEITTPIAAGAAPGVISVDPSGRYVYVVNTFNNDVLQYSIGNNGSLSAMTPATVTSCTSPASVTSTGTWQ